MKVLPLLAVLVVVMGLTGCGSRPHSESNLPSLGGAVVVATIGGNDQVLTYNESIDVVCLENTISLGVVARGNMSAFSCWETSSSPKKIQEVVSRFLAGKK